MSIAFYNENDPNAAAWLRELIKQRLIAPGIVDERSIEDITPNDLKGFRQCHFFAGIGVWSHALRKAGWSDLEKVWTGSCPCQPFSAAGKGKGFDDKRHLWPAFHWLIKECRPNVVFGEQVAGKAGETWLDLISSDLEGEGYTFGAVVTAACGFGAPHQRKRLYWVADSKIHRDWSLDGESQKGFRQKESDRGCGVSRVVANTTSERLQRGQFSRKSANTQQQTAERDGKIDRPGPTNGFWRDADWLGCRDGKWRPVEPGTFPLVDGAPSELVSSSDLSIPDVTSTKEARIMRLKGYGNAIVSQQAQAFIESYMDFCT